MLKTAQNPKQQNSIWKQSVMTQIKGNWDNLFEIWDSLAVNVNDDNESSSKESVLHWNAIY